MRPVVLVIVMLAFVLAPPAHAWTWPTDGRVLQTFSFSPADPYAAKQHRGIDVAGARGAPVAAPAGGTVTFAGTVPRGGQTVTIETADGYAVTLVHLGSIGVARGVTVDEGAAVGTIGPSGEAEFDEPYVHLGIRVASEPQGYVDPLGLLPSRTVLPPAPVGDPTSHAPAPHPAPVQPPTVADPPPPAEPQPDPVSVPVPQPAIPPSTPAPEAPVAPVAVHAPVVSAPAPVPPRARARPSAAHRCPRVLVRVRRPRRPVLRCSGRRPCA